MFFYRYFFIQVFFIFLFSFSSILASEIKDFGVKWSETLNFRSDKFFTVEENKEVKRENGGPFLMKMCCLETGPEGTDKLLESLKIQFSNLKNLEEIGAILHIHSLNELCCCCALSLSYEAEKTLGPQIKDIIKAHNEGLETSLEPFFALLVSASKPIPENTKTRPGIGKNRAFENLNIDEINKNSWVIQKLLTEKQLGNLPVLSDGEIISTILGILKEDKNNKGYHLNKKKFT